MAWRIHVMYSSYKLRAIQPSIFSPTLLTIFSQWLKKKNQCHLVHTCTCKWRETLLECLKLNESWNNTSVWFSTSSRKIYLILPCTHHRLLLGLFIEFLFVWLLHYKLFLLLNTIIEHSIKKCINQSWVCFFFKTASLPTLLQQPQEITLHCYAIIQLRSLFINTKYVRRALHIDRQTSETSVLSSRPPP